MCLILTAINPNSELKLVLASNRDEFYERPTKNMFWRTDKNILSGEDELKKGMWLGLNKNGSLAAVTNVRDFSDEVATVAFFCWTGWKFRPMSDNPYLPVQLDDDDDYEDDLDEYGLDDDIELATGGAKHEVKNDENLDSGSRSDDSEENGTKLVSKKNRSNTTLRMMSEDLDSWDDEELGKKDSSATL